MKTAKKVRFISRMNPKSLYFCSLMFNNMISKPSTNNFENTNILSIDNFTQIFSPRKPNSYLKTGPAMYSPIPDVF